MGEGMYYKVLKLRDSNPKLKVLLSVGDLRKTPDPYLPALMTAESRAAFAAKVVDYLRNRTFDGVVFEWSNLAANYNPRYDRGRFLELLKEIRMKINTDATSTKKSALILALTLPAKKPEIDQYPIADMAALADFITIRAFDLITAEDKKVGLSSPFLADPYAMGSDRTLSFKWAAEYYLTFNIPKAKINLGISTFGRSFQLKDPMKTRINSPAIDFGNIGPWSATVGIVGHYEICQYIWSGGEVHNVPYQGGRYFTSGSTWISYEDTLSITQKACYIMDKGFGGVTFWTLDLDDFSGNGCREGKYPIISTVVNVMNSPSKNICSKLNSTDYVEALTKRKLNLTKPILPSTGEEKLRVICYYASYAFFRRGKGLFVPENIDPNICTHLIYTYAVIQNNKVVPLIRKEASEPWREGLFDRFVKSKETNPFLSVLISIGGGAGETLIEKLPLDSETKKTMAMNVLSFLKEKGFDGLEITWEQPTVEKKQGFLDLLQVMRTTFDEDEKNGTPHFILTVALPAGKAKIDAFTGDELSIIELHTDFISIRTYDFHGSWETHTGINSPLFGDLYESGENVFLNVHWVAKYVYSLGIDKSHLNLGIPTYGRSYMLQAAENNELYSEVTGPGPAGDFTGTPGFLAFYEVCDLLSHGSQVVQVPSQGAVYTYQDKLWVSYEDLNTVAEKACYVSNFGFGGVNIWSLDTDDFVGASCELGKFPLVSAIYNISQNIDTSRCHTFEILESTAGAERELPGKHLMCLSLVAQLMIAFHQT
ncbi:hypothetical protein BsWGS_06638 [Bradybaena similaris]